MSGNEAEKTFWRTPELVEGLLPFLDPPAILELGKVHPLTIGVIQGKHNWTRFIGRSCPYPPANRPYDLPSEEGLEQKLTELEPISGILQLMGNPQFHLLQLLDTICKRFPAGDTRLDQHCIKVTCPNGVRDVSSLGFCVLETIEVNHGPSEQKVVSVHLACVHGPLIPALKARVERQAEAIRMDMINNCFHCRTGEDAEALITLARLTEGFSLRRLHIEGAIGVRGWAALAEGMLEVTGFRWLIVDTRDMMLEGRREDVRAVWDALPEDGCLHVGIGNYFRKQEEGAWMKLERYLDEVQAENVDPEN